MFADILVKTIGLFFALTMLTVGALILYPFTMQYAAFAAKTDPMAGIIIPVVGVIIFASWARSVLTSFSSDEA